MRKRHSKSFNYSTASRTTNSEPTPSPTSGLYSSPAQSGLKRAGQNAQIGLMLIEAQRQGILDLVLEIAHGWWYELDDAGRLWVFHPLVVGNRM